ncbi:MAG: hypothetical protein AAB602_03385 [Patescibacteria group bacterium]
MKNAYTITFRLVIFCLIVVAGLIAVTPRTQAAFGISPPFMNADHLVAGAKYTQTIYLVRDDPEAEIPIKAELDVPNYIRSWISLDQGYTFIIPKGVRQFPVNVTIQVPKGESVGSYTGRLSFTTAPASQGQVTIALGAQVAINLIIGNDTYRKFSVPLVRPLDIEEGWNPRVYVKFNNEGNIPESFTGGTFELLNQYGGIRLAYAEKRRDFPEVPPFTIKEFTVEFPIDFHLGIGQYWAVVNFYQGEKVVANQKTVFNVLKSGSLSSPLQKVLNSMRDSWVYYALGLLIIGIFVTLRKRRRSGK